MSNDRQSQPSKPSKPSKPKPKRPVKSDGEVRRAAVGRASAAARQLAAVILQVLAGELGTSEAAAALGKSPAQYYKLEVRALEGLLHGCEPRPRGRQRNSEQELARLQASHTRLERECARLQTLVRLLGKTAAGKVKSQRRPTKTSGAKKETAKPKKGKTKRRKGKVRALRLAAQMTDPVDTQPSPDVVSAEPARPTSPTPPARPGPLNNQGHKRKPPTRAQPR